MGYKPLVNNFCVFHKLSIVIARYVKLKALSEKCLLQVFLNRSWASVRGTTADQCAELLKRIANDNLNEKLSYKDCENIAKDLNLTLEQVRFYFAVMLFNPPSSCDQSVITICLF